MTKDRETSKWVLWALAHPVLSISVAGFLLLSMSAGVAMYLDHRVALLVAHEDVARPATEPTGAVPADIPEHIAVGQTVYVPMYSHILEGEGQRLPLAATLSIRNTDAAHGLTISSAKYFDTEGNLVRNFLEAPLKLNPMGSTDFFVRQSDMRGGAGANFVVEWVAEQPVHEPIMEAVMVGRSGTGIAAFTSSGRVLTHVDSKER